MKFFVPFLGKTRERYLDQAIVDYTKRLQRYVPVEIKVIKERHARNDAESVIMAREAEQLLNFAEKSSIIVALDPGGTMHDSPGIASIIASWENRGIQTVTFLIGGYLGLNNTVLQRADLKWSLSALTFTHEMTRFILLEQLYRACSIKCGHNYHK